MRPDEDPNALRGSEDRFLRGYGPVLCAVAAFLVMALIAPTVAPQKLVSIGGSASGVPQGGYPTSNSAPPSQTLGQATGPATSRPNANSSSAAGAAAGPSMGRAASCPGLQVPNDPYSPPCTTWSGGSNGGATSQGVSASTITIALRQTSIMDLASLISALTGKQTYGTSSTADVIRTYQVLADYFNEHFQFYGRKIQIKVFPAQGSPAEEALGGGQANATADAITEAQQLHAFADVSIDAPSFAQALVNQKVVAINPIYPSNAFFAQAAPYAWGVFADCTTISKTLIDFVVKYLKGRPTQYAAGGLQGQPRKLGLIFPDTPVYASCGNLLQQALAADGMPIADVKTYALDLSTLQQTAQSVVSAFANDGITTVLDYSDPVTTYFMTNYASEDNWTPEWVEGEIGYIDTDWAAQLFNQAEWSHAFGPSSSGSAEPARQTPGYQAYKSVSPGTTPAEDAAELIYQYLNLVAIGIQTAGPNLTPETFAQGLRSFQSPGVGPVGRWAFPAGSYTAPQDARIVWWNRKATSAYDASQGAYEDNGQRYPIGGFPSGQAPIFPNGIQ